MTTPENLMQLTEEDLTTLKKCKRISFWKGGVPLAVGGFLAVTLVEKAGFFAKFKMLRIPTYIMGTTICFILGRLSRIGECERMFLQLSDSRIKDAILRNQALGTSKYTYDSPILVNTPVEKHKPMSYAERREYYHRKSEQSKSPYPNSEPPTSTDEVTASNNTKSNLSYFDKDRPVSSFYYDNDDYRPRE
ncbi:hypothetical protein MN116_006314 [Schistosoma mekongi]|uniref:OCIA domain-containing protein n=1 Tax=Schistosoma mekongi TaxID=38744 RepID=A0AAE1ZBC2_SCHME|nr:hypothetical protein MN116_006314 [Schistosoma mekongi]